MKVTNGPLVSVVMPVKNAGYFLAEAINSILNQTYKNLELVVVNDASSDNTGGILSSVTDKRLKIFNNKACLGVTKSASIAISKARGKFIARMDGDDIAFADRITEQVQFLLKNKKVIAVGGQCDLINSDGVKIGEKRFPTQPDEVKRMIFTSIPVQQPALMVNKNLLPDDFVWYDENYSSAEELELLFKLFEFGEVRNLKSFLLKYRIHKGNTSLKNPKKTFFLTVRTRIAAIFRYSYRPTFGGVAMTVMELIFVSVIPGAWIYPIYSRIRGMTKLKVRMNFDANIILQKAFGLVKA